MSKQQGTIRGLASICTLVLILTPRPTAGQCELGTLATNDGPEANRFGRAVAISEDWLVVGAPGPHEGVHNEWSGDAYVFHRVGTEWVLGACPTPHEPWPYSWFGMAVAAGSNRVVVGAPRARGVPSTDQRPGAVYVYRWFHNAWHEEAFLTADDGDYGDRFGQSVAISDDRIVVGAPYHNLVDRDEGAAYVFELEGTAWIQKAKLTASDAATSDRFGYVSMGGEFVVVGAVGHDGAGDRAGAAYVYRNLGGTWIEEARLFPNTPPTLAQFGYASALQGDRLFIGAPENPYARDSPGFVQVYRREVGMWVEEAMLTAPTPEPGDLFGNSMAVGDAAVLIGAPGTDQPSINAGTAYLFGRTGTTWALHSEIAPGASHSGSYYGWAVALHDAVGVCASSSPFQVPRTGSADVFGLDGDCNSNGTVDICEIADGTSPDCSGDGIPDECDPDCNANGSPDSCDIFDEISTDCDYDGVPDECEMDQDADGDETADCIDGCPNDPEKTEPGLCDCGYADDDSDDDGTVDCFDRCQDDPGKVTPGICGCGAPDADTDGDGIMDCVAQIALVPVDATGPHTIMDNEIILSSGGMTVTFEIRIANWDPDPLRMWQVGIDMQGFTSGEAGTAYPLGWDRPMVTSPCSSDADCPAEWPVCSSFWGRCVGPNHDPEIGAFIDESRPDYVFAGLPSIPSVDLLGYRFGDVPLVLEGYPIYVPPPKYAATLILDLSDDAAGTFFIGYSEDTELKDPFYDYIIPLELMPARITIQPPDCGNGECELGEDEQSCPEDCAPQPVCGDGECEPGEDEISCPDDCAEAPVDGIPAVSTWGLVVLTMLLLVTGKVYFGRRVLLIEARDRSRRVC